MTGLTPPVDRIARPARYWHPNLDRVLGRRDPAPLHRHGDRRARHRQDDPGPADRLPRRRPRDGPLPDRLLRDPRQAARAQPGLTLLRPWADWARDPVQQPDRPAATRARTRRRTAIVSTARAQQATLVVLDGFRSMRGILAQTTRRWPISCIRWGPSWRCWARRRWCLVEGDPDESRALPGVDGLRRDPGAPSRAPGNSLPARARRREDARSGAARWDPSLHHRRQRRSRSTRASSRWSTPLEPAWNGRRAGFGLPEVDALVGGRPDRRRRRRWWRAAPASARRCSGCTSLAAARRPRNRCCSSASWRTPSSLREKAAGVRAGSGRGRSERSASGCWCCRAMTWRPIVSRTCCAREVEQRGVRRAGDRLGGRAGARDGRRHPQGRSS